MDAKGMMRQPGYWLRLAGLLGAAIGLFLILLHVAERAAYPASTDQRREIAYVGLDAAGRVIENGTRQTAKVGDVAAAGYFGPPVEGSSATRFLIPFTIADPGASLAFYLSTRSDVGNVRLNGVEIAASEPLERQQGDVSSEPAYFPVPAGAVRAGANLLTIDKPTGLGVASLSSFAIGSAEPLASAYRVRRLLLVDMPPIGIAILSFTALLCLIANWPEGDRRRMRSLVVLLLVSAGTTVALTYAPQGQMPLWMTIGLYALANLIMAIAVLAYAGEDSGLVRLRRSWLAGLVALAVLATGFWLWWAHQSPTDMGLRFATLVRSAFWLFILTGSAAMAMLLHAVAAQQGRMWAERLAFILCFAFLLIDRVGTLVPLKSPFDATLPITLPWSPVVGALLGVAVIVSLARQASEARRTVVEANSILAARLAEQDAELAQTYDRQRELLARQAVLEERQRIVRDMHDGIGGQLLGLMMQVRSGQADQAVVASGLQASITDLRLIVDSMDTAEGGLTEALHAFEHRARTLVEASGMQFLFDHGLGDRAIHFPPRTTLSILRILQEAVSNAVQHSGGTRVSVHSTVAGNQLVLTVADDGTGLPSERRSGRGIINIETRARELGGSVSWSSVEPTGTSMTLTLDVA